MHRTNTLQTAYTFIFQLLLMGLIASLATSHSCRAQDTQADSFTTRPAAKKLIAPDADEVFHFVIYGDRTGGVPAGLAFLRQAVVDTNLIDPDLVMTVGDLIEGYSKKPEWIEQMKEYHTIMAKLNMDWYPVAGNHDIYWVGKGPVPEGHHESNYEEHFGPLWYSFEHKNTGFIVLYSDEGDPKTNKKGFNDFGLQTMSDTQLAFLDKALEKLGAARQVFVFIHHPRWINRPGYASGNWDVVHKKLTDAGNVKAVFAGHIHRMRFDKPDDGIEYYTLATTGGHLAADIPDAGHLHHINMVSVRENSFSVSSMAVGAVFDPKEFTAEFSAEVDLARSVRPIQTSPAIELKPDGTASGTVTLELENPSPRTVRGTLAFDAQTATGWGSTLDHRHLELAPLESINVTFKVRRFSGTEELGALPEVIFNPVFVGQTLTVDLPDQAVPLKLKLDKVADDFFNGAVNRALNVTGPDAAVAIANQDVPLPDGPMTLEAWVKPPSAEALIGHNAIIAKTQNSEYAFFSDEGVPQFDIHVGGRYASAKASEKLPVDAWTHLAGVFDGQTVKLFVNGKLAGEVAGKGKRRKNKLALFVGADPDRGNLPTRPFTGLIDEVRLSSSAVYAKAFEPARVLKTRDDSVLMLHLDKRIGPFVVDRTSRQAKGVLGRAAELVPIQTRSASE